MLLPAPARPDRARARVQGGTDGEGADEALAGYVWFKSQKLRNAFGSRYGLFLPKLLRQVMLRSIGGASSRWPDLLAIGGFDRAARCYDILGQTRTLLYSGGMWDRLGDQSATTTWESLAIG